MNTPETEAGMNRSSFREHIKQALDEAEAPTEVNDKQFTLQERIQWLYVETLRLKSENALLKSAIRQLVMDTTLL